MILSTILSGNSQQHIGDALCSALKFVHAVLLIDTGITDGTRQVAGEVLGEESAGSGDPRRTERVAEEVLEEQSAGSGDPRRTGGSGEARRTRLIVEEFRWCDDFAKARNFALDAAARHGATWAMTLDTDERMEFPGYASREELLAALESDPKVRVWLVMEKGGRYAKERFVRVGSQRSEVEGRRSEVKWVGRVHEALVGAGPGEAKVLPGVLFWEVAKSAERHRAKLTRDLAILRVETRDKPSDPRWWYYLGQTLHGLSRSQNRPQRGDRHILLRRLRKMSQSPSCARRPRPFASARACQAGLSRRLGRATKGPSVLSS